MTQTHSANYYFSDMFKIWQQFVYKVGFTRQGQLRTRDMFDVFLFTLYLLYFLLKFTRAYIYLNKFYQKLFLIWGL